MRILIALTYYRPHVSGLTIYGQRLARGLAQRGHQVTLLTSQFHPALPVREMVDGVDVRRVPILRKLSKGVVMPLFPLYAAALVPQHDVVNIHMPQLESALLAILARALRRPVVLTYHCDLKLPEGLTNRVVEGSLVPMNHLAARLADRVVASTDDYASHSDYLSRYLSKVRAILPPIELPPLQAEISQRMAQRWSLGERPTIGFAARFAAEKGVEYLLEALPAIAAQIPDVQVVFTGAYKDTVGEEDYRRRLEPLIDQQRDRLIFLDLLSDEEMPSFYSLCDVLAVTSLNATEAFGMVQAEAMLCGTPVVATDLPGVREAVRRTGMGEVVAPHDSAALSAALLRVLQQPTVYERSIEDVGATFAPELSVRQYEQLFEELAAQPLVAR